MKPLKLEKIKPTAKTWQDLTVAWETTRTYVVAAVSFMADLTCKILVKLCFYHDIFR